MKPRIHAVFASFIGNTLEYYDFCLYGALLPIISSYFFPLFKEGPNWGLIIYALTFMVRPLGAVLFGYIGDKFGRKVTLEISLICTALFTLLFTLIPSYNQIGFLSPILLVIARLGQGFCMGGEYGGSLVFAMEHYNKHKSLAVIGGIIGTSALLGCFFANITSYLFTLSIFSFEFWRIPFLIGSGIGFTGFWIRRKTKESPEFIQIKRNQSPVTKRNNFFSSFESLSSFLKSGALAGLTGFAGSFTNVYLNIYIVNELRWNLNSSLLVISFGLIISIIVTPLISKLHETLNTKNILRFCLLGYIVCSYPCMILLSTNKIFNVYLAMFIFSTLSGIAWGTVNYSIYNLFSIKHRCTNITLSDSLGRLLFSGSTPYFCSLFLETFQFKQAPAFYIIILMIVIWIIIEFPHNLRRKSILKTENKIKRR